MEDIKIAITKAAEERALKYKNMITMAAEIQTGVIEVTNGLNNNYEQIKNKYDQLRDFKELKYS